MIEKYRAKQRRNRALIFSVIVHAIVIIVIAIWLLKPLVEQEKDSITVDFVSLPQGIHAPKKIVQEVSQNNAAASIQDPAVQRPSAFTGTNPRYYGATESRATRRLHRSKSHPFG